MLTYKLFIVHIIMYLIVHKLCNSTPAHTVRMKMYIVVNRYILQTMSGLVGSLSSLQLWESSAIAESDDTSMSVGMSINVLFLCL